MKGLDNNAAIFYHCTGWGRNPGGFCGGRLACRALFDDLFDDFKLLLLQHFDTAGSVRKCHKDGIELDIGIVCDRWQALLLSAL
jgi:hypothetical protein